MYSDLSKILENRPSDTRKALFPSVGNRAKVVGGTGLEQSALAPRKTPISTKSGAKCGALDDKNDSELAKLVEVWPSLPEHTKTKITDLIEKHSTERKADGDKKKKS